MKFDGDYDEFTKANEEIHAHPLTPRCAWIWKVEGMKCIYYYISFGLSVAKCWEINTANYVQHIL